MRFTGPFSPQLADPCVEAGFTDGHGFTGSLDGVVLIENELGTFEFEFWREARPCGLSHRITC